MDNLLKRLQQEAGLTEQQAVKAVSVIKDQMDKGTLDIEWDRFFKGKYEDLLGKAKGAVGDVSSQAGSYKDKIADKVDDLTDNARKGLKDLSQKAVDFFDDDKKA